MGILSDERKTLCRCSEVYEFTTDSDVPMLTSELMKIGSGAEPWLKLSYKHTIT